MSENSEPRGFKTSTNPFRWGVLVGVWLSYFCFGLTVTCLGDAFMYLLCASRAML